MIDSNYIIIYPTQIEPSLPSPDFGRDGRHTEAEYLEYLTAAQPLINIYAHTGELPVTSIFDTDIHKVFFNPDSMIVVKRSDVDTFIPWGNGYHRMYVAHKYGLKLIAYMYDV